jgi:hypothetical protein
MRCAYDGRTRAVDTAPLAMPGRAIPGADVGINRARQVTGTTRILSFVFYHWNGHVFHSSLASVFFFLQPTPTSTAQHDRGFIQSHKIHSFTQY